MRPLLGWEIDTLGRCWQRRLGSLCAPLRENPVCALFGWLGSMDTLTSRIKLGGETNDGA
jgi:hypothetical protein